jgi:hypothetical protein
MPESTQRTALVDIPEIDFENGDARKAFADIRSTVNELVKREREVDIDTRLKMKEELERVTTLQDELDKSVKNGSRTQIHDFTPMLPILHSEHLVPEDTRATAGYYVLCSFSPDELRFGAGFRTLDNSPVQRAARLAEWAGDAMIREFQMVNDQLYIADLIMCGNGKTNYARISSNPVERMKTLKLWKEWDRVTKPFERVLSTGTATAGGNWVPTQLSERLLERIKPLLKVAALFPSFDMATKVVEYPIVGADPIAFRVPESGQIPLSDLVTNKITFTAVKLGTRTIASTEVLEDAAIALEPMVMDSISGSIANAIEDVILNGDTAIAAGNTTAQDYDLQNGAAQNAGYLNDRRGAWDGLRKFSLISGMPNVDLDTTGTSKFILKNLLSIRAAMKATAGGSFFNGTPSDLAWIVGNAGYMELLMVSESAALGSGVLWKDRYPAGATFETGEIGQLFGTPIVYSPFIREDVNGAGAVNTMAGPNTKTYLHLVNRRAFALGRRRDITVQRSADHRFDTDEIEYTGTWRGHFRDLYPVAAAANKSVGIGRNIAS